MAQLYDESSTSGALRQGEILRGVREFRLKGGCLLDKLGADEQLAVPAEVAIHPVAIVLSPDCDLEWDYRARNEEANPSTKLMSHVLLCDLEDAAAIREERVRSSEIFKRVQQNQDERYHFLRAGNGGSGSSIQEYYIDFKRMFSLPTEYIVHETESGRIKRLGILRPPWNQHLTHRFIFFLGRVGLPDEP